MSVWDDLPLGPSLSGLTLKSCTAHARSEPSFACNVRRTLGEDLSVFVEGMKGILLGEHGPTRRLALLCTEHGLGREPDWEVIFSGSIRAAAYKNACAMHSHATLELSRSDTALHLAESIVDWWSSTSQSSAMATLEAFGAETRIVYHEDSHEWADVSKWEETDKADTVLRIDMPRHYKLVIPPMNNMYGAPWSKQLDAMHSDYTAAEQKTLLVLSKWDMHFSLPAMYSALSYGSALSLPQPPGPEPLLDFAVHSDPCSKCGGNWCFKEDGTFSSMRMGKTPGCTAMCHTECGEHGKTASTELFLGDPCALPCGKERTYHRHGPVTACYGIVERGGSWWPLIGPWPVQESLDAEWAFHPCVMARAVTFASHAVGLDQWVSLDKGVGAETISSLLSANLDNSVLSDKGKRARARALTFVGYIMWYGHVMICDRIPEIGYIQPGGKIEPHTPCSAGFTRTLATLSPVDRYTACIPSCLVTPGIARTLLDMEVYDRSGMHDTFYTLLHMSELDEPVANVDSLMSTWLTMQAPLIVRNVPEGAVCQSAKHMHDFVFSMLSSLKTQHRAQPRTPPSTWAVDTAPPAYCDDPMDVLLKVTGIRPPILAREWARRLEWLPPVPAPIPVMDVGVPCDPCTELGVRIMLNFGSYARLHRQLGRGLAEQFSEEFSDAAFAEFEANECSALPPVLTRIVWEHFRTRCTESFVYGWVFYYMAVHGDAYDSSHVEDSTVPRPCEKFAAHLDPSVQRNVPWGGGWSMPRALLKATNSVFVDLGHGEFRYHSEILPLCTRIVAFEIDLNAIRVAYSTFKDRSSMEMVSKVHFVPTTWEGFDLGLLRAPCMVAVAYRPGTKPPEMGSRPFHLLAADCRTAQGWDFPEAVETNAFFEAVDFRNHSGRWQHFASHKHVVDDAVAAVAFSKAVQM